MPSAAAFAFMAATMAGHAARIVVAERVRGAILGGHQRQMHQVAARQGGADGQPRKRRPWVSRGPPW